MEIIFSNTKLSVKSVPIVTKGNLNLVTTGAHVTGSAPGVWRWGLNACTGLKKVIGINFIAGSYLDNDQYFTNSSFYKFNKTTKESTLIVNYTATQEEIGNVKHLDVDVDLAENEYIVMGHTMYYKTSGGDSFSYNINNHDYTDPSTVQLYYNIEGYE